ncbi:MAG: NAD(P)-dependent oxidoreductase [Clostridia bacterium]|nr:NAD(P)-dependent oxidoreductase [Clostridia bacterium]
MKEEIKEKAEYCLNCQNPQCRIGCPLGNHIPDFIAQVKQGDYQKAYEILCETTVLPAICGRICPHQKQCQGKCIRGIKGEPVSIGEIEKTVGDWALEKEDSLLNCYLKQGMPKETNGKKVAVIGGGPAGLTASSFLRKSGYEVTIYEKQKDLGGILKRGIPEFRLSKDIVEKVIAQILSLGIHVEYEKELGKNLNIAELEKEYDAIFLSIGANIPRKMMIEGEELEGVFGGNSLLELGNHPDYHGKKVSIIGGGNVAMDCARTIKRLGAEQVVVIYRRSEEEMPAEVKEIEDAKQEGVEFLFLTNITKVLGNEKVEQIECIKTMLVEKEGEKRKVPVDIEDSNYCIPMDYVVMAVGGKADKEMLKEQDIAIGTRKYVSVDENGKTSNQKVFAGGDVVGQTATVAWAARDGREVAKKIVEYLEEN